MVWTLKYAEKGPEYAIVAKRKSGITPKNTRYLFMLSWCYFVPWRSEVLKEFGHECLPNHELSNYSTETFVLQNAALVRSLSQNMSFGSCSGGGRTSFLYSYDRNWAGTFNAISQNRFLETRLLKLKERWMLCSIRCLPFRRLVV